jgi:NAD(P) transhydrogenase
LDFVDNEIEDALYYNMRDEGITLRFGERVSRVVPSEDGRVLVSLESGKNLTTDSLMFSAGREGATGGLNLENLGIRTDHRGRIEVDETYRTPVENIYAAGDVIGFPSLASTSMSRAGSRRCRRSASRRPRCRPRCPTGCTPSPRSR